MSAMLESATKPRIQEDKILRFLVEGTVSETGSEFFRALARNLSEALQTYGAWVTEYLPETRRLRALAFWLKDGFLDHFEHAIDGTPCQPVIETKSRAHFPERLLDFFPNDPDLAAIGAVSYMGTPLLDTDGTLLGHLAVLDNRPMPAEPQLYELFDLFAARAVAELRRLRAESATREREAQLSLLLDTAMDAILVLDEKFSITRLNPRATELFACTEEDLAGENFLDFLGPTAAAEFSRLAKELQDRPGEASSVVAGRFGGNPLGQDARSRRGSDFALPLQWRAILHRVSSQHERAIGGRAAHSGARRGGGILARGCRRGARRNGYHRPQRGDPRRLQFDPPSCADRRDGPHPGRDRHGQGTRGPRNPRCGRAPR